MEFLYPDVRYRNMLVHSERVYGGGYLLQLFKNNVVVMQQTFHDWGSYSQQYDSVRTMLNARAGMGY